MRDAFVIFLKSAFAAAEDDVQLLWSDAARGVAIDYVDANIDQRIAAPVSLHIGSSRAAMAALEKRLPMDAEVGLVDHHWDPRLNGLDSSKERFRCGYFGHPANTIPQASLERHVEFPRNDAGFVMTDETLSEMARTPLHFGVRPAESSVNHTVFKPFTKGFNAAAVGSSILVNRQVNDAVRFLGDDYPFLIDETGEEAVLAGLACAEAAFGTSIWRDALERMRSVRNATELCACVGQLDALLTQMMDLSLIAET